jgi:hypothetical protein
LGAEHGSSVAEFAEIFEGRVEAVLQGVFDFSGVFWLVNRGEFVVDSWWDRGFLMVGFVDRKTRHDFEVYFCPPA